MNKYLAFFILYITLFFSFNLMAQESKDTVYFKNRERQEVIITKLSKRKITFKADKNSRLEHVIKRGKIEKIEFADGFSKLYQSQENLFKRKVGVSSSIYAGGGFENQLMFMADYMIGKGWNVALKVNSYRFIGGLRYYFFPYSDKKLWLSTGVFLGNIDMYMTSYNLNGLISQIPLELLYIFHSGFTIRTELSYNYAEGITTTDSYNLNFNKKYVGAEIGIGYRF